MKSVPFLACLALSLASCEKAPASGHLPVLFAAPDFTLSDLSGNSVQLSALQGKAVVISFWFLK